MSKPCVCVRIARLFAAHVLGLGLALAAAAPAHATAPAAPALTTARAIDTVATRVDYEWFWDHTDEPLDSVSRRLHHGLKLATRSADTYAQIGYYNSLGWVGLRYGDYVQAQRYLTTALARARTAGESRRLWQTYLHLGLLATVQEDGARALGFFEQALAALRTLRGGSPTAEADILVRVITAHAQLGHVAAATRLGVPALRQFRQQQDTMAEVSLRTNWATVCVKRYPDSALALLAPALHILRNRRPGNYDRTLARAVRLQALTYRGDCATVLATAPALLREARLVNSLELDILILECQATCLRRRGSVAAYDTLQLVLALKDSVHRTNQAAEMAQQRVLFDVVGQRARIRELEQQRHIATLSAERQHTRTRQLRGVALGLAVLLLGAAYFYRRLHLARAALVASEGELRQANATKDQLMAIIGHDLRGPAAAFQMAGPLLRSVLASPSAAEQLGPVLSSLEANAHELAVLLDTLLHWARAQTGRLVAHPLALPAGRVLREAVAPYQAQASLKGVGLTVEVPPTLLVWADPDLLQTVLRNLISNAVKFTPAGGSVRVTAQEAPAAPGSAAPQLASSCAALGVWFQVQDTGVGLDAARTAHLLNPDQSAALSTPGTAGETGTGLGLPLSARFVVLLGGVLRLIPAATGARGTTLGFWLPTQSPSAGSGA